MNVNVVVVLMTMMLLGECSSIGKQRCSTRMGRSGVNLMETYWKLIGTLLEANLCLMIELLWL